jgi:hypothetical protein
MPWLIWLTLDNRRTAGHFVARGSYTSVCGKLVRGYPDQHNSTNLRRVCQKCLMNTEVIAMNKRIATRARNAASGVPP